jgi:cysteine/O-acetylserine efflux protein
MRLRGFWNTIKPALEALMPNLLAFLSYVIMTTFTPGPNNIMSMSNASRYGMRKSIGFNFGVFAGFLIIITLSSLFSEMIYQMMPSVKPYMTYIGAAYILWLAWKTYKSKPHKDNNEKRKTNTFKAGLMLQFVNPKVILYCITITATFITPYYNGVMAIAGFAVFLASVGLLSTCVWGLFGSLFQLFLAKNYRTVNTIMALLLVYCAASLF